MGERNLRERYEMTESGNLELVNAESVNAESADVLHPIPEEPSPDLVLRSSAARLARSLAWMPGQQESRDFTDRSRALADSLQPLLAALEAPAKNDSEDYQRLRANVPLLKAELEEMRRTFNLPHKIPQVRTPDGEVASRVAALAQDFLADVSYRFSEPAFTFYIKAFQEVTVLKLAELWMIIPAMRLALLEEITDQGSGLLKNPSSSSGIQQPLRSLQEMKQVSWKLVIEPLIVFDQVLREDPAGAYAGMDYESRDLYRGTVVNIAEHSDCAEIKVARHALDLAREAYRHPDKDPRVTLRDSHVGNYLLADGACALEEKVGFNPPFAQRARSWLRRHPDDFYLPGIAVLTFAIVSCIVLLLTRPSTPLGLVLLSLVAVLLPSSQSAVQIMNYLATLLIPAQILPKLDFSEGLPSDRVTMVAIPTILLNEKQVRRLVDALEVRFLGNQDPNLHFALLTDLPDSPSEPVEDNSLVELATTLIQRLNEKYEAQGAGSFFLLHRHRSYNPHERLWMGWERKRGKLMDMNNLLRGQLDSFPRKVGNLSILSSVRYIITLDSDTELPRGSARRMVGALAHPLNQAIIDRDKGIVVAGYGILQPRVGVSVQSTARSRLASIYSGQTGFDIYTHATSDVYQDLYGEGIFVGKGIYEVETLHSVLHGRFPRNALLSHDLMEGAYARAGLVSDIEVIEDYPSHYSAHNRRKHRWLRGDWQITEWLLPQVPDESGRKVPNPLSPISRWKILDNLRRSLVEPALFLLFLLSWICLPDRSAYWTLGTIGILFLPALFQLAYELCRAAIFGRSAAVVEAFNGFLNASIANWLMVTFLAHQALLSMDAVVRTMVRRMITRQKLLEWETAAEAELAGEKRTMLDIYLNWTPVLALGLFGLVRLVNRNATAAALPILLLWGLSKPISIWLNRPPRAPRRQESESNRWLLRTAALRIWRYYAEFSTEQHNWLVPDNVQEEGPKVATRISPTNLGFLLNARQVACEFGYLTVGEFAQHTLRTLATASKLQKHRGHLLNWYDTESLAPLPPNVVSSVDSGNLVACLWTLERGCIKLLAEPLLQPKLREGILDSLYVAASLGALPRRKFSAIEKSLRQNNWLQYLMALPESVLAEINPDYSRAKHAAEARWFQEQAEQRIRQVRRAVQLYTPWLLPEFALLGVDLPSVELPSNDLPGQLRPQSLPALDQMTGFIDRLADQLKAAFDSNGSAGKSALSQKLLSLLPAARSNVVGLIEDLNKISNQAGKFADEMDFKFLFNPRRGLLSVAFEVDKNLLINSYYDLLSSEARIAYFVAIAKDDIPQDSWFQLSRTPTEDQGMIALLSWSGTMFEYLMPTLWMRLYPNTLLERSSIAAVRSQQAYADDKGVPWGISESAYVRMDEAGNYRYFAFGVPQLAIHKPDFSGPVISPYSTLLALSIDPPAALRNLRMMQRKRWLGDYGFYEALDFSPSRQHSQPRRPQLVRCWMAHHLGMSLLSIANYLRDEVVHDWFHSHPRVQATELLLQEKPAWPLGKQSSGAKAA
jgi:cyclic beta-1,2-glucan synthetase